MVSPGVISFPVAEWADDLLPHDVMKKEERQRSVIFISFIFAVVKILNVGWSVGN